MKLFISTLLAVLIVISNPDSLFAQEKAPSASEYLSTLTKRMKENPKDLEAFFKYAKLSTKMGRLKSAENAYLHMLKVNPNLPKVKLALAIVYIKMANNEAAKKLFEEVLATNPPQKIKDNILATLKSIDKKSTAKVVMPKKVKETAKTAKQAPQAAAQANDDAKQAKEKAEFAKLRKEIDANPDMLDKYFAYAKLAEKLGEPDEAERAYKHMLSKDPGLDRVMLDLGLLYVATGKLEEAKEQFETVLAKNPPDKVKENINTILTKVNKALRRDIISVSTSFGINRDSNATSAAASGNTTFADTSIDLAQNSLAKADAQFFGSLSLTHLHKFKVDSKNWGLNLTSTGTYYKTSQTTDHNLDLSLISFKTGPTVILPKLKSQVSVNGTLSVITLDSFKYMRTRNAELAIKYAPTNKLAFDSATAYEYRKFSNSPTTLTNVDRTGHAYQQKLGATYTLTDKDIINGSITWRNENARADKYGLDQLTLSAGYTRVLPYKLILSTVANLKMNHYNDLDTSISTTKLRNDRDRNITFSLSRKLPKNVTATASYQYKNSKSNIQNYTYVNHKLSTSISWSF